MIDLSPSLDFGTARCEKRDLVIAAVAAMAHLTGRGGNRFGALVTTGEQLHRFPAQSGRVHTHRAAAQAGRDAALAPGQAR